MRMSATDPAPSGPKDVNNYAVWLHFSWEMTK